MRQLHDLGQHLLANLRQLLVAHQPLQQRHRATANQRDQRRRALHLQCLGNLRVRGNVDARELNLPVHRVHRIGERMSHREQSVVGGHPQEQQNREGGRGLHHRLERALRGVDDVAASRRRATGLPRFGLDLMLERLQVNGSRERHSGIERALSSHICHICLLPDSFTALTAPPP